MLRRARARQFTTSHPRGVRVSSKIGGILDSSSRMRKTNPSQNSRCGSPRSLARSEKSTPLSLFGRFRRGSRRKRKTTPSRVRTTAATSSAAVSALSGDEGARAGRAKVGAFTVGHQAINETGAESFVTHGDVSESAPAPTAETRDMRMTLLHSLSKVSPPVRLRLTLIICDFSPHIRALSKVGTCALPFVR